MKTYPHSPVTGGYYVPDPEDPKRQVKDLGITKREYFAAMLLQGIITKQALSADSVRDVTLYAKEALMGAEILIKVLNENNKILPEE